MKALTIQNYTVLRNAGMWAKGAYYIGKYYAKSGDIVIPDRPGYYGLDFSDKSKPLTGIKAN